MVVTHPQAIPLSDPRGSDPTTMSLESKVCSSSRDPAAGSPGRKTRREKNRKMFEGPFYDGGFITGGRSSPGFWGRNVAVTTETACFP